MLVVDASAVFAALVDGGPTGDAARQALDGHGLAAPSLMAFEVTDILRRHVAARLLADALASQAYADLLDLAVEAWPFEAVAERVWSLRRDLTAYDAAYVAVAESAGCPLVTLDRRIRRSRAVRCEVIVPV